MKKHKKPKPIKVTLLTPSEQKERASQIKQNQAEYEKEHKRYEKYISQLPPATAKTQANRFLDKVREIRQYLCSIRYQEGFDGIAQKYDLYKQFIQSLTDITKANLKNCPDFGDFPDLVGNAYVPALTRFIEYCEHAAGLLEGSVNPAQVRDGTYEHSPDYRSVKWNGTLHTFNPTQAIIIKLLWESETSIHEKTIAEAISTFASKYRLVDSFKRGKKKHPAWSTMIKHLGNGVYTLAKPENKIL